MWGSVPAGDLVAGRDERTAAAVFAARRLHHRAAPGQILAASHVLALARGVLDAPCRVLGNGGGDGLEVQLTVVRAHEPHAGVTVSQRMTARDAADSCLRLAKNLAKKLALQEPRVPWYRVGTRNSRAFLRYLEGLDTAAAFDAGLAGKKTATDAAPHITDTA